MSYRDAIEAVQPYFTLFGPLLAAWFVVRGWERNHTDASDRDLKDWRRTTFMNTANPVLEDVERIRIDVGNHVISDEELGQKILALNVKLKTFEALKLDRFAREYQLIVNTLATEIPFRRYEDASRLWLTSIFIPEMASKLTALIIEELEPPLRSRKPSSMRTYWNEITDPGKPLLASIFRKHRRTSP